MHVHAEKPSASANHERTPLWVPLMFAIVFGWWILDLNFATTSLVTPINDALLSVARAVGAVTFAWGAMWGLLRELTRRKTKIRKTALVFYVVGSGFGFAIFGSLIAEAAVRRAVNFYLFWNSQAPIVRVDFPIREVPALKGTPAVSIGLQGHLERFEISRKDYELLGGAGKQDRPWEYCLSLLEQRQGGAVRVWRPPRLRVRFDGITIVRCPDSSRLVD